MFSTIVKILLATCSIAAGVAGAVYLATASPGDIAFALRMPSIEMRRDASHWHSPGTVPERQLQLPGEPAPFYLPSDQQVASTAWQRGRR